MTPSPKMDDKEAVFKFLLGEGPLDGLWFGDLGKAPFWWRKHLRAALRQDSLGGVLEEISYSAVRHQVLEEAAKECDALGRMAPNQQRGLGYDIAAKCIRELKRPQVTPLSANSALAAPQESRSEVLEALECAEYALAHPSSDQQFALNAVRSALASSAEPGLSFQERCERQPTAWATPAPSVDYARGDPVIRATLIGPGGRVELALNVRHPKCHAAADAFWKYWKENGETHKHGYYESTWGAINAALKLVGVRTHNYPSASLKINAAGQDNKAEAGAADGPGRKAPSSGSLPNTPGPASAAPEIESNLVRNFKRDQKKYAAEHPDWVPPWATPELINPQTGIGSSTGTRLFAATEPALTLTSPTRIEQAAHARGLAEGLEEGAKVVETFLTLAAKFMLPSIATAIRAKIKPRTDEGEGK